MLSQFKFLLQSNIALNFQLENGEDIPKHFHITEVGFIQKHFIDCGGTERIEKKVNFQLWVDNTDPAHRLEASKLMKIIELSEQIIELPDAEIEVEYQQSTIGKFGLDYQGNSLVLTSSKTACLALDQCGIPAQKPRIRISANGPSCDPKSGCC